MALDRSKWIDFGILGIVERGRREHAINNARNESVVRTRSGRCACAAMFVATCEEFPGGDSQEAHLAHRQWSDCRPAIDCRRWPASRLCLRCGTQSPGSSHFSCSLRNDLPDLPDLSDRDRIQSSVLPGIVWDDCGIRSCTVMRSTENATGVAPIWLNYFSRLSLQWRPPRAAVAGRIQANPRSVVPTMKRGATLAPFPCNARVSKPISWRVRELPS